VTSVRDRNKPSPSPAILPIIALLASIVAPGCGKVGPPVAPARLAIRTSDLKAVQRGGTVVLNWPAPPVITQPSNRNYIERAEVFRLVERRDGEPVLDPDDFEERSRLVGVVDRAAIEAQVKGRGGLTFADTIDLSSRDELEKIRLRYAIRYVNKRGQEAAFSNTIAVEPGAIVAEPPSRLRIVNLRQDEVGVEWDPPKMNADGSAPALVAGYNVYRQLSGRPPASEPLNSEPLADPTFTDRRFRYRAEYTYFVRAVSPSGKGLVESTDSEPVRFVPEDKFAPAAPDPVTLASANGVISLFWPSSSQPDVVGYLVYRSDAGQADGENAGKDPDAGDWARLVPQPITTTTFRDDRVVLGKKYFYKVTAIDRFDNESPTSRIVSETANP
jgi:hypothetical protein